MRYREVLGFKGGGKDYYSVLTDKPSTSKTSVNLLCRLSMSRLFSSQKHFSSASLNPFVAAC